jgi:hypothetical protein
MTPGHDPFLPNADFKGCLTHGVARNANNATEQDLFRKPHKAKQVAPSQVFGHHRFLVAVLEKAVNDQPMVCFRTSKWVTKEIMRIWGIIKIKAKTLSSCAVV